MTEKRRLRKDVTIQLEDDGSFCLIEDAVYYPFSSGAANMKALTEPIPEEEDGPKDPRGYASPQILDLGKILRDIETKPIPEEEATGEGQHVSEEAVKSFRSRMTEPDPLADLLARIEALERRLGLHNIKDLGTLEFNDGMDDEPLAPAAEEPSAEEEATGEEPKVFTSQWNTGKPDADGFTWETFPQDDPRIADLLARIEALEEREVDHGDKIGQLMSKAGLARSVPTVRSPTPTTEGPSAEEVDHISRAMWRRVYAPVEWDQGRDIQRLRMRAAAREAYRLIRAHEKPMRDQTDAS